MADCACRHRPGSRVKYFFHEHRAIRKIFRSLAAVMPICQPIGNKTNKIKTAAPMNVITRSLPSIAFCYMRNAALLSSSLFGTLGKGDLVQYPVELRPDLVSLGAPDMAKCAFRFCLDLGGRSLRLVMIEIEVSPGPGVGKALRILDSHIRAIELAREKTPSRRLCS